MFWYCAPAMLILLHSALGFPRGKTTEMPEIPLMVNPKQRPTHISEFTDPDTGLNPFLDLEEGPTSVGRNVMEDERRDDEPYFDLDLVEGDAPDRRWNLQEPKEHFGRIPVRRPELDYKDESDFPVLTTPLILPNPPTTVELFITKDMENSNRDVDHAKETTQHKVKKEETESLFVSQSTVIYASATIAVITILILLVGACWWRKKLKSPRSPTTVESGEEKS